MTANENIQLERIEVKIDTLNEFMATYTEKSIHCKTRFDGVDVTIKELKKMAEWNRTKIIGAMFIFGTLVWVLEKLMK